MPPVTQGPKSLETPATPSAGAPVANPSLIGDSIGAVPPQPVPTGEAARMLTGVEFAVARDLAGNPNTRDSAAVMQSRAANIAFLSQLKQIQQSLNGGQSSYCKYLPTSLNSLSPTTPVFAPMANSPAVNLYNPTTGKSTILVPYDLLSNPTHTQANNFTGYGSQPVFAPIIAGKFYKATYTNTNSAGDTTTGTTMLVPIDSFSNPNQPNGNGSDRAVNPNNGNNFNPNNSSTCRPNGGGGGGGLFGGGGGGLLGLLRIGSMIGMMSLLFRGGGIGGGGLGMLGGLSMVGLLLGRGGFGGLGGGGGGGYSPYGPNGNPFSPRPNPYGPNPYGPYNPYNSNPYGPNPYSANPYGPNPYSTNPYGLNYNTNPYNL